MIARIRSWWKHLGYMKPNPDAIARGYWVWGVRPWRGCPFFMFVADVHDSARQSKKHLAECEECRAAECMSQDGNASKSKAM